MTISGRWLALADWAIALFITGSAFFAGFWTGIGSMLISGVFVWLGVRAYKSVDHW